MFRKIADVLAVAFHPVFMGTIVLILMSLEKGDLSNFYFFLCIGYILFFGLFIPVAGTYLLYKDIHLHHRQQRFWPLIISLVSHLILLFLLKPFYEHKALMCGAILMCINMLILLGFTIFIKASMHANAMAIVMALFAITYTIVTVFAPTPIPLLLTFSAVMILFGIITWQRYVSKAHTIAELLAGFVSGFISVGLMLFYIDTFGY